MNPKISDFGMARIFITQSEANTNRIVGTYGYMAPEYVMGGIFSEKSDVFSFGVLLLEIVSGRKNNSFYHSDPPINLVEYAWQLWKEVVDRLSPLHRCHCRHHYHRSPAVLEQPRRSLGGARLLQTTQSSQIEIAQSSLSLRASSSVATLLDYGAGNVRSVRNAIRPLGFDIKDDVSGSSGAQVDQSQWNAYYGYGQGYDPYAYGAAHDPSLYAHGAYAGYPQYPQQGNINSIQV
ncbi:hypothetical protein Q3G72_026047 [Acer saccharum]|nr:hypothetical protein Q3G72_026047 [Acer saccharum]